MKHRNIACGMIVLLVILIFTGGCGTKKETESQHQYTTLSELEDKRIGVTTGSVQAIQARERFPDADLFYYDTTTDMLTALRAGKIDAFAVPLIFTAVIYFLLSALLIALLRGLEKRICPESRRTDEIEKLLQAWKSEDREHPEQEQAVSVSTSGGSRDQEPALEPAAPEKPDRAAGPGGSSGSEELPGQSRNPENVLFRVSHLQKSFGNVTPVRISAVKSEKAMSSP